MKTIGLAQTFSYEHLIQFFPTKNYTCTLALVLEQAAYPWPLSDAISTPCHEKTRAIISNSEQESVDTTLWLDHAI